MDHQLDAVRDLKETAIDKDLPPITNIYVNIYHHHKGPQFLSSFSLSFYLIVFFILSF